MLSKLIITNLRFVLIVDEISQERNADRLLRQFLREQGQDEKLAVKTLPFNPALKDATTFSNFITECTKNEIKCNVLLPALSDLLCYQNAENILQFVHKLRNCKQVQRVFLWISTANLMHPRSEYLIAAFEYLADIVLHLQTPTTLSVTTRKAGGGVTNKRYTYIKTKKEFLVEPLQSCQKSVQVNASTTITDAVGATFKIELDEDEMVARNALKLPYEKTSGLNVSSIIYTPDAADDYDDEEEDPDDDLCI